LKLEVKKVFAMFTTLISTSMCNGNGRTKDKQRKKKKEINNLYIKIALKEHMGSYEG